MRIVSLLPSATEIVASLGQLRSLVGRSHECDFPAHVTRLPICSRAKINIDTPGRVIDASVRSLVERGLSVFEIDTEALRLARPDLVITQTHCEVCAVSETEVLQALAEWLHYTPEVVSLTPNRLADVYEDITRIGNATSRSAESQALRESMIAGLDRLKATIWPSSPTVACLEWLDPLMAAGNWVPELVEIAGGMNVVGNPGEHSDWLSLEELETLDPDVIICMPCGFDLSRTREEAKKLVATPRWQNLQAVRTGRFYLTDGHNYFNRPGPRLLHSARMLTEMFHPKICPQTFSASAWEMLRPDNVHKQSSPGC